MDTEVVAMAWGYAPCGCPSKTDAAGTMTEHRQGCDFIEDLLARSEGVDHDPWTTMFSSPPAPPAPREPSQAEVALAESYRRHSSDLEAIDDAYADDSWRSWA
jgi:hypothetical protein